MVYGNGKTYYQIGFKAFFVRLRSKALHFSNRFFSGKSTELAGEKM